MGNSEARFRTCPGLPFGHSPKVNANTPATRRLKNSLCVALRFPTADINSPAAAGVNCQEEGGNEAVVEIYDVHSGGSGSAHGAIRGYGGYFPA